jgi:hypothetical protein
LNIYIVAQASDEYNDTLQLRDVLKTQSGLTPYWTANEKNFKPLAFQSLDKAKRYLESFDKKPAFSDGSGNMKNELSIFETELN